MLRVFLFVFLMMVASLRGALILSPASTNGPSGSQVVIPIRVTNFTTINNFQFSFRWNPSVISYVTAEQFGLAGLSSGNIGTTETNAGAIRVSWDEVQGGSASLADGTTLLAIRFQLTGAPGQQSSLGFANAPIITEFYDENFAPVTIVTNSGRVSIDSAATPPVITTQPQSQTVAAGSSAAFAVAASGTAPLSYQWRKDNVPIGGATATAYNIAAVQASHGGDYLCVVSNSAGSVTSSVARLTVTLPDTTPPSVAITSPTGQPSWTNQQSTVNLAGSASDNVGVTQVTWSNERGGSGTAVGTTSWSVTGIVLQPGTNVLNITARDAANNTATDTLIVIYRPIGTPLYLAIANTNGIPGNQVVVPIRATNFTGITLFGFSVAWDPSVITYVGVEQFGVPGLSEAFFGASEASLGRLRVSWDDVSLVGATVPAGGIVFSIRFQLSGVAGSSTPVRITNSPVVIEAADSDFSDVPVIPLQGLVALFAPPSLTTQPQGQTVAAGADVTLAVSATGSQPLRYQWRRDQVNISGATSDSLTLSDIQVSQAGDYVCVVTNMAGSVTSAVARVTVNPPPQRPVINTQPQGQTVTTGANPSFTIAATGTEPLSYFWRKDGTALPGANGPTLNLSNVQLANAGDYVCVVSNVAGSVTSAVARLTVHPPPQPPSITTQPQGQTVTAGTNVTFSVVATGTAPLSYQWRHDPNFGGANSTSPIPGANAATYALPTVQLAHAGDYVCVVSNAAGSVTSAVARLTVHPPPQPPLITTQPQSQIVLVGADVTFALEATGTTPLSYQWRRNNTNLAGATAPTLALSNVQIAHSGDYVCVVSNVAGSVTSAVARLTVNTAPEPPVILTQPQSQTVTVGSNVTFTVAAGGTAPLSYQWKRDNAVLNGATSSTLTLPNVQLSQAGDYVCVVSNVAGTVVSAAALLTVNPAPQRPSITSQPQGATVTAGTNVTLSVAASGTAPLSYQWRRDNVNLPAGTAATLSLLNVQVSHSGDYVCVVSNVAGSVTSAVARLTVNPAPQPPVITTQPVSRTVTAGDDVTLTVAATGTAPLSYQWRLDGVNISGTSPTLNLSNIQTNQAGDYTCLISNVAGVLVSATARITVNPPPDTTAPVVTITSPTTSSTFSLATNRVTVGGTASDNIGVTQVTWSNSRGGSGTANGTTSWTVATIALQPGTNLVTVTARDAADNRGTDTITIIYTPPVPGALTLALGSTNGLPENQVLVPLRVSGFQRINNFQFCVHWDESELAFVGVEQFGLTGLTSGSFGTGQTSSGDLIVSWDDPDSGSQSLADGSLLFSIRFRLIGPGGNSSDIYIDGIPRSMEAYNHDLLSVPIVVSTGRITINGGNAAPVLAGIGPKTVAENTTLSFTAVANDPDVPPQTLTFALDPGAPPGASIHPASGVFSWTPNEAQGPSTNLVTVRVTDNGNPAAADTEIIQIIVTELNGNPVLNPIGNKSLNEGEALTFTATAFDLDEPEQSLTFSLQNGPAGATIHPSTGAFSWSPSEAHGPGIISVTIRVTDNGTPPLSDTEVISITVGEINAAPVLAPIGNKTVSENATLTFSAGALDSDLPAQNLTFSLIGAPAGATIDADTGLFSWRPTESQGPSTNVLTVRVVDNGSPALADSETITVFVTEVNGAPVLSPIGNKTANEIGLLTFTAVATDGDLPLQQLTFSLDPDAPAGASINPGSGVFTWQHTEADGPSTNLLTVRVTDNGSPPLSASETIRVTINEVNADPVLSPVGNKAARQGQLLSFTVLANDTDLPRQALTFSLQGAPAGAVIHPSTGLFTWTPAPEQSPSTNTLIIRVTDIAGRSDSEAIVVTVNGLNTAPVLDNIGDSTVVEGQVITFTAEAEDEDVPRQTLSFSLVPGAPAGASIHPASGLFSWTPAESQGPGRYPITVRVTDSGSPPLSDFKTLNIEVLEANSAPVISPIDPKTVPEGSLLSFTVVTVDSDLPPQVLAYTIDDPPDGVSLDANGLFTWRPSEAQGPSTNLFVVRVTDDGSPPFSHFQTFSVVVTEVNSAPVLEPMTDRTVVEGTTVNIPITAVDEDLPVQRLTFSLLSSPSGASIDANSGLFSWTTTETSGPGTNLIVVRVTDDAPAPRADTNSFIIVVTETNAAPVLNSIGNKAVQEGVELRFTVSASDVDRPVQSLTYSFGSGAPTGASLDALTGVFTWTPAELQGPSTNSVVIIVSDNGEPVRSDSEIVTIVVSEANLPPVLGSIGNRAVRGGNVLTFTASASDPDLPAQALRFSLDPSAISAVIDPITGVFTWQPTPQQTPSTNVVTIRVTDSGTPALADAETILLFVTDANEPPVLTPISNKTVAEGSLLTFTATANDSDLPAQQLTFSLESGAPAGASIHPATGVFRWTPTEAQGPSTNFITIRVTDNGSPGLSDSETLTVFVTEVENSPVFDLIPQQTATEGSLFSLTARAVDPDTPPREIVYSLVSVQPPTCCAGVAIDSESGRFTWTPTETQGPSTNVITLRATEVGPGGFSDTLAFTIIVLEVNSPPILERSGDKWVTEGSPLTFTVVASDRDVPGQTLSFTLEPGAPPGATIARTTGVFSWTPTEAQGPSTNTVTIRVTDNGTPPASESETISIVVAELNQPPVLNVIGNKSVTKTNLLSFTATATDPDLPAQSLTFSLDPGAPAGAAIHPETGVFTWTPSISQGPSTNLITVRVTDNPPDGVAVFTDAEVITVIVVEGNSPPTVTPIEAQTVAEGTQLRFTVVASDSDVPPATLRYSLEGEPPGATINQNTGVFSWTPSEAQGPSTNIFIVRATEVGDGISGIATIAVFVTEVNTAPVLPGLANRTVAEGSVLSFEAAAADGDLPPQLLSYSLDPGAPAGAAISPDTGLFTWTPSESQGPSTNFITIRVRDNGEPPLEDAQTIRIAVSEANATPVLDSIPDQLVPEGILMTLTANATDSDLPAQQLTFSLGAGAPAGTAIDPVSGVFTWTPTEAQGPGTNVLTIRVTDNGTPPASGTVSFVIRVYETNNAPVLQAIGDKTVPENSLLTFTARATDGDTPAQTLTYSLDEGFPLGASIHPSTGVFSWTPEEWQGPGAVMVTIRVTDNGTPSASAAETIRIVVTEVNRPPAFTPFATNRVIAENALHTFPVEARDPDDPEQTVSYALAGNVPQGATIDPANGVFRWTPTEAQGPGTNVFVIRAVDNGSPPLSNSVTVTMVVDEINVAPVLSPIQNVVANENTPITFTASASDTDLPAQRLRFTLEGVAPVGATINTTNGLFSWTPTEGQGPSTNLISIRVTDSGSPALSATQTVSVVVSEVNSPPVITPTAGRTVAERSTLGFTVAASDADLPPQRLSFSLGIGAPIGASIDPVSGLFSWTPSEAQGPSTNVITVLVADDGIPPQTSTDSIQVVVTELNSPPSLAPISSKNIPESTLLTFTVSATDADLPPQSFTYALGAGAPAGASINPSTGVFSWTPSEAQGPSTNLIAIRVTDSGPPPLSATQTVLITVFETNNAPVLQAIGDRVVAELSLLTFTARATDSDLPAQTLTYSLDEGAPVGAAIHPVTGVFTWTPQDWQAPATNLLIVRVTDNGTPPRNSFEEIVVVVNEVNSPPSLQANGTTGVEGTLVSFTARGQDSDLPEQVLTYVLAGNVPAGASIHPESGVFSWIPTEAQGPSTNTFLVRVIDDGTPPLSNSVTVTVTILESNSAPSLTPVSPQSAAEENLFSFTISASDPDLPAQRLRFSLEGEIPAGLTIHQTNGVVTWTPTEAQGPSTNVFSVRVVDNGVPPLSNAISMVIIVVEGNAPPVLAPIGNKAVLEDSLLTFTAGATDADTPAQVLRFTLDPGAPAGAAIDPVTGVFTWTPGERQAPSTNIFTVRVTDNHPSVPLSDFETFQVIVIESNAAPTILPIENKSVAENVLLSFAVLAGDPDLPAQDLTFALTAGPGGAVLDPVTGVFSWVPQEDHGGSTNLCTIRVTDNGSPPLSATVSFLVLVTEANAAPVITPIAPLIVEEGNFLTFTVSATDADLPAQQLTFSLSAGPAGASIHPVTGVFTWTPTEAQGPSTNIVNVRVADNGSPPQSPTIAVSIIVSENNTAPVLATIGNKAARRNNTLEFTASAVDSDLPSQRLTFSLDPGAPAGASIDPNTGEFEWRPSSAQSPSTNIVTVRVTDNSTPSLSDFETILIVVDGANFSPVLSSISNKSVSEGSLLTFGASASDPDTGQVLTFTLAGPAGANIDPSTGVFSWTPSEAQGPGSYTITIAVTDNGQPPLTAIRTFNVQVSEVNAAPELAPIADRIIAKGVSLAFAMVATDPDVPVQTLVYSLGSAPSGAVIDPQTGVFAWTPGPAQSPSTNTITVQVRDNGSPVRTASRSFTVVVSEDPSDLQLSMLASPLNPGRGEVVTYTLVVSNAGPGIAVGVVLTNLLPANATFIAANPAPVLGTDGVLLFDLGLLLPGAATNVDVGVKTTSAGTLVCSAQAGSLGLEVNAEDNSAALTSTVGADPSLALSDAVVTEINRSRNMATFELTLSAPSRKTIEVEYFTVRHTAAQNKDFVMVRKILRFPPGVTRRLLRVPVLGDTLSEADETFYLRLRRPRNARIRRGQGIGTILNNDAEPAISISDARTLEGNTVRSNAVFTVRLSRPSGKTVTVNYSTSDRSALGGQDYVATNGTITFTPGVVVRTLRIPIISERIFETNETFVVNLVNPVNAALADQEGVATIVNDDRFVPAPAQAIPAVVNTLRISAAAVFERDVQITFATIADKSYVLEYCDDLSHRAWRPAAAPVQGTGGSLTVTDPGGATYPVRFYRVRILD